MITKKTAVLPAAAIAMAALFFMPHRYCENCERMTAYGIVAVPTHCCIGTSARCSLIYCKLAILADKEFPPEGPRMSREEARGLLTGLPFRGFGKELMFVPLASDDWLIRDTLPDDFPTHFALDSGGKIHRAKGRPAGVEDPAIE